MANRRQQRRREKQQRHASRPAGVSDDAQLAGQVQPLAYTREQAAQALGVSLATLDRRVVAAIATVKTEWGARLIPVAELERYLAERQDEPRTQRRRRAPFGRRSALPPEVVARIRREHTHGASLGEIARRLNRDDIPNRPRWTPMVAIDRAPSSSARSRPLRSSGKRVGQSPL
jgi:hypothetical protein